MQQVRPLKELDAIHAGQVQVRRHQRHLVAAVSQPLQSVQASLGSVGGQPPGSRSRSDEPAPTRSWRGPADQRPRQTAPGRRARPRGWFHHPWSCSPSPLEDFAVGQVGRPGCRWRCRASDSRYPGYISSPRSAPETTSLQQLGAAAQSTPATTLAPNTKPSTALTIQTHTAPLFQPALTVSVPVITDGHHRHALRSTRNHPRTAMRRGAAWPPAARPSSCVAVQPAVSRWQVPHRRAVMVAERRVCRPQQHGSPSHRALVALSASTCPASGRPVSGVRHVSSVRRPVHVQRPRAWCPRVRYPVPCPRPVSSASVRHPCPLCPYR